MTCVTYTELFRCLMRHKYIIDRKSTQFVDDHIHIRGNIFEILAILQFCKLNIFKLWRGGINWTPDSESAYIYCYKTIECTSDEKPSLTSVIIVNRSHMQN